jgi:hypothetical protein
MIEDDMKQAIENEKSSIRTEISVYYDVPGMSVTKAQKYIYYHLLCALRRGKYTPKLELTKQNTAFIHVTWVTKKDTDNEAHMDRVIAAHLLRPTGDAESGSKAGSGRKFA